MTQDKRSYSALGSKLQTPNSQTPQTLIDILTLLHWPGAQRDFPRWQLVSFPGIKKGRYFYRPY